MTAPQKKHPDVTALAPRFIAYMDARGGDWGPLFGPLMHHEDHDPEGYRQHVPDGDAEGHALFDLLRELTETQRRKLSVLLQVAQNTRVSRTPERRRRPEAR